MSQRIAPQRKRPDTLDVRPLDPVGRDSATFETPPVALEQAETTTTQISDASLQTAPAGPIGHDFTTIRTFAGGPMAASDDPTAGMPPTPLPFILQAALRVNAPDDLYEGEANRVATMVMRMPVPD